MKRVVRWGSSTELTNLVMLLYVIRAIGALRQYALGRVKSSRLPSTASSPGSGHQQQQQSVKVIPIHQLMAVRSVQEMVRLRIVTDNVRPNPKQRKKRQQQLQQARGR